MAFSVWIGESEGIVGDQDAGGADAIAAVKMDAPTVSEIIENIVLKRNRSDAVDIDAVIEVLVIGR